MFERDSLTTEHKVTASILEHGALFSFSKLCAVFPFKLPTCYFCVSFSFCTFYCIFPSSLHWKRPEILDVINLWLNSLRRGDVRPKNNAFFRPTILLLWTQYCVSSHVLSHAITKALLYPIQT